MYYGAAAITPHDTNLLPRPTLAIYVGGAGALKVKTADGNDVTFPAVPVGTIIPIRAQQVFATGTVATNLVALY